MTISKTALLAATFSCVLLAGCTGTLKLAEDRKVHIDSYDQLSKSVTINLDGVPYSGTYLQGVTAGFLTSFNGGGTAMGTGVMSDGSGQALLLSPDGKALRCVFGSVVGWRGQGQCQNNAGKLYDLLIGS